MRLILKVFYYLLYHPFAIFYDLVAWIVSFGQWNNWIESVVPHITGNIVLEIGFGPGHLQESIKTPERDVFGIDASLQMVRIAYRRLLKTGQTANLARAMSQKLPFPNTTFKSIVITFPSEYIYSQETLSEVMRVLDQSGKLILLPAVWIKPDSLKSKFSQFLFKSTQQIPKGNNQWLVPFLDAGFELKSENWINHTSSSVLVLIFEKP